MPRGDFGVGLKSRGFSWVEVGLKNRGFSWVEVGVPSRARTCDPRFRKPVLYPAELPGTGEFSVCEAPRAPNSKHTQRRRTYTEAHVAASASCANAAFVRANMFINAPWLASSPKGSRKAAPSLSDRDAGLTIGGLTPTDTGTIRASGLGAGNGAAWTLRGVGDCKSAIWGCQARPGGRRLSPEARRRLPPGQSAWRPQASPAGGEGLDLFRLEARRGLAGARQRPRRGSGTWGRTCTTNR